MQSCADDRAKLWRESSSADCFLFLFSLMRTRRRSNEDYMREHLASWWTFDGLVLKDRSKISIKLMFTRTQLTHNLFLISSFTNTFSLFWTHIIWPDQRIETKPRERSKGQRVALLGFNPSGQYAFI